MHNGKVIRWILTAVSLAKIWSRRILIPMIINELGSGVCTYEYPYHVTTLHWTLIALSTQIMHLSEILLRKFSFQCSLRDHMVESTGHIAFSVNIFYNSHTLAEILWIRISVIVVVKGSWGVAHRHEYSCPVATSHSTSVTFSIKIMVWLRDILISVAINELCSVLCIHPYM